jgi:hypothetical protein
MDKSEPLSVADLEIAPGVKVRDWQALHLKNNPRNEDDWKRAIAIVEARLTARYFDPCELLIREDNKERPSNGFAIMALCCLLAETLQSFIEGETSTDVSNTLSVKFLTRSDTFRNDFDEETAQTYYKDFRCGILHVGETCGLSRVWAEGPLVVEVPGGLIINRTKFFEALKTEFRAYLARLQDPAPSQTRTALRNKLKKKMSFICRTHDLANEIAANE